MAACNKKSGSKPLTPNGVFYNVNYNRRIRKVKKNREELPATTDLQSHNPAGKEKARILLLAISDTPKD
jgi:hypothetical protein